MHFWWGFKTDSQHKTMQEFSAVTIICPRTALSRPAQNWMFHKVTSPTPTHIQKHKNYQNLASSFWQIKNKQIQIISICLRASGLYKPFETHNKCERHDDIGFYQDCTGHQIHFIIFMRWQKLILQRYLAGPRRSNEVIFWQFFHNETGLGKILEKCARKPFSICGFGGFPVCWTLKPQNQLL